VATHAPGVAALEEIFAHKSAASALVLGQARGVAMLAVADLPLCTYNASTIKKTVTGNGRADKSQVCNMVSRLLGRNDTLPADEADAVAIAITHLNHARVAAVARAANPHAAVLEAAFGRKRKPSRDVWTAIARQAGLTR
jgi:crossover junction endodeoxyribonuclease RuvC